MRVKLCARCPYLPQDLAELYDPKASFHLCVRCDGETARRELTIPADIQWRDKMCDKHEGI